MAVLSKIILIILLCIFSHYRKQMW